MSGLVERWRQRLQHAPSPAAELVAPSESVVIDRAAMIAAEFPREFPVAEAVASRVLAAASTADLAPLARRSPALRGFDWTGYIRCSVARVVRVQRALLEHVAAGGRVLDFGSYFGNFSIACREVGFEVDAIDAYRDYGAALASCAAVQRDAGVTVLDFADTGHALGGIGPVYDAVVCAGVIEHVPHTPRFVLEGLTSVIKAGGVLVLDTPNLAYLYRRLALLEGQSIFAPIAQQYYTEVPFEGHHREYTIAEVEWMIHAVGHEVVSLETFNYSLLAQTLLTGDDVGYFYAMKSDPALREIITVVSRQGVARTP